MIKCQAIGKNHSFLVIPRNVFKKATYSSKAVVTTTAHWGDLWQKPATPNTQYFKL